MVNATFEMSKTGFEISLGLTGVLTFWTGIMKIGEKGGIDHVSRMIGPFFNKLFPELGKNHPAYGPMILNFAANMMGIDYAATPMGSQHARDAGKHPAQRGCLQCTDYVSGIECLRIVFDPHLNNGLQGANGARRPV